MAMGDKVIDPKNCVVIVDGTVITGFTDGDFVSIERNEDRAFPRIGADGTFVITKNNNNSGSITLTLLENSPAQVKLSSLSTSMKRFTTTIKNNNEGGFNVVATTCYILTEPPNVRSKEPNDRAWVIWAGSITMNDF